MPQQGNEWEAVKIAYCHGCMRTVHFGKRNDKDGTIYYVCLGNAHVMGGDGCGRRVEVWDGGHEPQAPAELAGLSSPG